MTKAFRLENLCCANCAAQIERKLNKLDGVNEAVLNFMTTKLTMDIEDSKSEEVLAEAEKVIKRIEPEVVIKKA